MKKFLIALIISILTVPQASSANESGNSVSMQLVPETELNANKLTKIKLKLTEIKTGKPVGEKGLKIAHTKKLHLLVIDPTFVDYQHIHPIETKNEGEFVFDFIPKKNGNYRFWADITPVTTGTQEYIIADLGKETREKIVIDKTTSNEATFDGYKFKLLFDSELAAGKATMGTLKIQDQNGKEITNLEPVMGAFAHIVAFSEDYKTVVHIHPIGKEPESDAERGGPELEFHIEPKNPGFIKLFVQVKISGKDIFVPFGLNVSSNFLVMN